MIALRPVHVWALLVAATLCSFFLAEGHSAAKVATSGIILIAAIKISLVVGHFMELKWQPRPYRIVISGWLLVVTLIIIGGNWAT